MKLSPEQKSLCVRSLASALVRLRSVPLVSIRNVQTDLYVGQYVIFQSILSVLSPRHTQLKYTIKNKKTEARHRVKLEDVLPTDCVIAIQSFARTDSASRNPIWTYRNRSGVQDCLRFVHPAVALLDENAKRNPFHGKVNVATLPQLGTKHRIINNTGKKPAKRKPSTTKAIPKKIWGQPKLDTSLFRQRQREALQTYLAEKQNNSP